MRRPTGQRVRCVRLDDRIRELTVPGIPPKKIHFHDKKDLFTHGVMYFNHGDTTLMQNDYGAHYYQHPKPLGSVPGKDGVTATTKELFSKTGSSTAVNQPTAKEIKRLSLQSNHNRSRSFGKNDAPPAGAPPHPQRNYRMFPVGDYLYSFEFPIDGSLPETIKTEMGFVRYDMEASVERSGAFRPNLFGTLEVPVIRTPAEGSLEQVEPIAISRNWEDQLHYDIVISGKSFPLGSQVPIAFKLTPLAKVECHRIKMFVSENIQHWTADKSVHRFQPAKKVLLFEKRADSASTSTYPGSSMRVTAGGGIDYDRREAAARGDEVVDRNRTNLLGNLGDDSGIGPTEMEFSVQLPSCYEMKNKEESQKLHFDTTYENIQINHWIKVCVPLGYLPMLTYRSYYVCPRSTNETPGRGGISKYPSTHPSTSFPAKPLKETSTSQPTHHRTRTRHLCRRNTNAAVPAHPWSDDEVLQAPNHQTGARPTQGRYREASRTARAGSPDHPSHTSHTTSKTHIPKQTRTPIQTRTPDQCTSSAHHPTHPRISKTNPLLRP